MGRGLYYGCIVNSETWASNLTFGSCRLPVLTLERIAITHVFHKAVGRLGCVYDHFAKLQSYPRKGIMITS